MILHVVLFRFKPDVAAERIARAGEAFLAMRGAIPDIRGVSWGANLGPSAAEYSHVLIVTLDDMAGVERYLEHHVHRRTVAAFVADIREARLAVDVEAKPGPPTHTAIS